MSSEQIDKVRERFISEVTEHQMTVLRDDELYRHIRFQKPGTAIYHFDLVTWPGHLAITGDCGSFLFARIADMFEFFVSQGTDPFADSHWGINPDYWSEKLQAPAHDAARSYSYDAYREHVLSWFEDVSEDLGPAEIASLRSAIEKQLLDDDSAAIHSEYDAHMALTEFEHDGLRISDSWEWDLREWRWDFLWCCWAIVWGIGHYRAGVTASA